ncbi:BtrH N-terminal domain-containing protein [Desulfofustis limnaeus]|jgi:hypothetical protein|uniref:Peptidase n=1 Tax=Desulfofustis limnaeus TaxID=2740163 RepID=A0ABM7W5R8_9BACT|nr:BtrH N-terminal domain-containing protein [Desulfofustis limnaeus]MDX9896247.1 BtrH N-terminal domain-containing protein [Desulfofustis sp.]BDD86279.1 peptidase [Desulfofustis limnaeus]
MANLCPEAFPHRQSAHCESGVVSNLLRREGVEVSEAMAFGIGRGLFFGYLPFIRLNGLPLVTYRSVAGRIIRHFSKFPGISLQQKTFRDRRRAMVELDEALAAGRPVGLQTGVFWLPYFPRALRFHFNAHNLVVYGKAGEDYLISDPVFPAPVRCPAPDLERARFAAGALAPRGKMYWFQITDELFSPRLHIRAALDGVCRAMLGSPFPLIGVRGMRFLAGRLVRWPERLGHQRTILHLGHIVRMQEEIGTGGGGFRFMFSSFLRESAELLADRQLRAGAERMMQAGDEWRGFAAMAARICKERTRPGDSCLALAASLRSCAAQEEAIFWELSRWCREGR